MLKIILNAVCLSNLENYLTVRRDSVVRYRVNLLLEVEFEDEFYNATNKLSSFFGQIGVYENTEKLLNLVNSYYKYLNLSFLVFKEKSDFNKNKKLLNNEENLKMFFKFEDDFDEQENEIEGLNLLKKLKMIEFSLKNHYLLGSKQISIKMEFKSRVGRKGVLNKKNLIKKNVFLNKYKTIILND